MYDSTNAINISFLEKYQTLNFCFLHLSTKLRYSILAVVVGVLFIVLGLLFPVDLNCEFLPGGGNQSCPPVTIGPAFTLTFESVLILLWGSVLLAVGILARYDKI